MERLIDPVIADLQAEYAAAIRSGNMWKSGWVLTAGYIAFVKVFLLCGVLGTRRGWRDFSPDEQRDLTRILWRAAVVTGIATVLVGLPTLMRLRQYVLIANASPGLLIVYLVPSLLALSLPTGLAIAVAAGSGMRSRRLIAVLYVAALLASVASLVNVAWVTPMANQLFRVEVMGRPVPRGQRELSLTELSGSAGARFAFHARLSLAAAPLTFATFGLVAATRRWRRRSAILAAVIAAVSFVVVLMTGGSFSDGGLLPPRLTAWLPQVLLASATILIARLPSATAPVTQTRA